MTTTTTLPSLELESQAIRAASARWLRAVDDRDTSRAADFYAEDGLFMVPNAPLARGRHEIAALWARLLDAPNLALSWAPASVEVGPSADLACEVGAYQLAVDGPAGRIEDDGKYVVVWRKRGDAWEMAADIFNSSRPLSTIDTGASTKALADQFVRFLETGNVPLGLFTDDVFCDFTLPTWRLQSLGVDDLIRLRKEGHRGPGSVPRWRHDPTPTGFVIEFEERWTHDAHDWYSREMARADVVNGRIASISVYCTGDWSRERRDAHADAVQLIRP